MRYNTLLRRACTGRAHPHISPVLTQIPAAKPRALDEPAPAPAQEAEQTAIDAYAPKKPHLDLKRDAARSLRKLERATQRAIDELRVELQLQEGQEAAGGEAGTAQ